MHISMCEGFWNCLPYWPHFQALVLGFFPLPKIVYFKNAIVVLKLLPQGLKNHHLKASMSSLYETESIDYCREWCCVLNLPGVLFCQLSFLSSIYLTCPDYIYIYISCFPAALKMLLFLLVYENKPTKTLIESTIPSGTALIHLINSLTQEKKQTQHCTIWWTTAGDKLHSGRGNNNQEIIGIVMNTSSKENRVAFEECHLNEDPSDQEVRKEH